LDSLEDNFPYALMGKSNLMLYPYITVVRMYIAHLNDLDNLCGVSGSNCTGDPNFWHVGFGGQIRLSSDMVFRWILKIHTICYNYFVAYPS
jgi:hypothetical protein